MVPWITSSTASASPGPAAPTKSHFTLLYPNQAGVGAHSAPHGWAALLCPVAQLHTDLQPCRLFCHTRSAPNSSWPLLQLPLWIHYSGADLGAGAPSRQTHLHTTTPTPSCHPGEPDIPCPTPSLRPKPRATTWSSCSRSIPSAPWHMTSLLHGDKVSHCCSLQSPRSPAPSRVLPALLLCPHLPPLPAGSEHCTKVICKDTKHHPSRALSPGEVAAGSARDRKSVV